MDKEQDFNNSILQALYESSIGTSEVKLITKVLMETRSELLDVQARLDSLYAAVRERKSLPLTQEEKDEIEELRLKYNKALKPEDHDRDHNK